MPIAYHFPSWLHPWPMTLHLDQSDLADCFWIHPDLLGSILALPPAANTTLPPPKATQDNIIFPSILYTALFYFKTRFLYDHRNSTWYSVLLPTRLWFQKRKQLCAFQWTGFAAIYNVGRLSLLVQVCERKGGWLRRKTLLPKQISKNRMRFLEAVMLFWFQDDRYWGLQKVSTPSKHCRGVMVGGNKRGEKLGARKPSAE